MNNSEFLNSLKELNRYEQIGKQFYLSQGFEMTHLHLLYLLNNPNLSDPVKVLTSSHAQKEIDDLASQNSSMNSDYLSAKDFLEDRNNIEIQQLMRFIHIPKHRHDFVELAFVLSGSCRHVINGIEFNHHPGDFTVIPPDLSHEQFADEDCVCLTVKIRKEKFLELFSDILVNNSRLSSYFTQVLSSSYYNCALTIHGNDDGFLRECVLRMYAQQLEEKPYNDTIIVLLLSLIFTYLLQNYQDSIELLVADSVRDAKMLEVMTYIFENYRDITLQNTANHFYFSIPYLSAQIRKKTGKTFSELLQEYRLQQAAGILKNRDMRLDLLCEIVGYKNTSRFIQSFKKKYGLTPIQYRKKCKTEHQQ